MTLTELEMELTKRYGYYEIFLSKNTEYYLLSVTPCNESNPIPVTVSGHFLSMKSFGSRGTTLEGCIDDVIKQLSTTAENIP